MFQLIYSSDRRMCGSYILGVGVEGRVSGQHRVQDATHLPKQEGNEERKAY